MNARRLRFGRISAAILLLAIASAVFVTVLRRPILRAAGWALVADDPIGPADVIVLAVDAGSAGVLEAADLVRAAVATKVGIFAKPSEPAEGEFFRRGVHYEDEAAQSARYLRSLGVTTVERIPGTATGTAAQGQILVEWCARHKYRSVVVVSNADHSRRLRRVFRRSTRGHDLNVSVRFARFSTFDPDQWWETRAGVRTEIVELQKLVLDVALHPIP